MEANKRNKTDISLIKVLTTLEKARQSYYGGRHYVTLCNVIQLIRTVAVRGQTEGGRHWD